MLNPQPRSIALVVETFDIDPDGTQFAWHRFECPVFVGEVSDHFPHLGPVDVSRVMTVGEFNKTILPDLDAHGRDYWAREGYANSGSRSCDD